MEHSIIFNKNSCISITIILFSISRFIKRPCSCSLQVFPFIEQMKRIEDLRKNLLWLHNNKVTSIISAISMHPRNMLWNLPINLRIHLIKNNKKQIKTGKQWIWKPNVLCWRQWTIVLSYSPKSLSGTTIKLVEHAYGTREKNVKSLQFHILDLLQQLHYISHSVRHVFLPLQWLQFAAP